jgi:hypothetical protein
MTRDRAMAWLLCWTMMLVLLLAPAIARAQTAQPLGIKATATTTTTTTTVCSVTVTQPWSPAPPDTGWTFRPTWRVQGATVQQPFPVDTTPSPWASTRNGFAAGVAYTLGGTWTKGATLVRIPEAAYTCQGGTTTPPPTNAPCVGSWRLEGVIAELECRPDNLRTIVERFRFTVTTPATGTGTCPAVDGATEERRRDVACTFTPPPPPPTKTVFGVVDPSILGTCSAAAHDAHVVDIGHPTKLFRTWHPQTDPTGCIYGHEHGQDPKTMRDAEISSVPVAFGVVGEAHKTPAEPNGHEEPHEGFKVFIANVGDVNDEGRVNRVFSRSVFHMGTGGPRRFEQRFHSAMIRLIHPEFGLKAFTQLMMDTGGVGAVCDPRVQAPVKDVMQLNSPCKLTSGYEIWSTQQSVRYQGREVYRAFATPAVFDPITVRNPANPTELVYAWDPRMAASKLHADDWSQNRSCDRESYAQPGYWDNATGSTSYWTDAMGQEVAAGAPGALLQELSRSKSVGAPATVDGLLQFKNRIGFCQQRSRLGLKN